MRFVCSNQSLSKTYLVIIYWHSFSIKKLSLLMHRLKKKIVCVHFTLQCFCSLWSFTDMVTWTDKDYLENFYFCALQNKQVDIARESAVPLCQQEYKTHLDNCTMTHHHCPDKRVSQLKGTQESVHDYEENWIIKTLGTLQGGDHWPRIRLMGNPLIR